jgi:2-succinyl-6-hydroxy-2,4-cyclohexadiene-1-carboxylate synthase
MIWCVSGFLGLPSDWDFLPWPHAAYEEGRGDEDDVIIGYSMGGRRAIAVASRFRKAVIVSAGLNAPDAERRQRDEAWAQQFENDPWPELMRDWNAQPVFGGHSVERHERDYDRHELARQLREWSPAVLSPPELESIATPVLWVAGARDEKYVAIGREAVRRLPHSQLWICPDAGHRVPWEQPEAFVARLRQFLELQ